MYHSHWIWRVTTTVGQPIWRMKPALTSHESSVRLCSVSERKQYLRLSLLFQYTLRSTILDSYSPFLDFIFSFKTWRNEYLPVWSFNEITYWMTLLQMNYLGLEVFGMLYFFSLIWNICTYMRCFSARIQVCIWNSFMVRIYLIHTVWR